MHLHGERLQGRWTLVPAHLDGDERNWLIIKKHDDEPRDAGRGEHRSAADAGRADRAAARRRRSWLFEVKWDGFRALGAVRGDEATLRSRTGVDLSARLRGGRPRAAPRAAHAPTAWSTARCARSTSRAARASACSSATAARSPTTCSTCSSSSGEPLVDQPLEQRREQLEALIVPDTPIVRLSAAFDDGQALLAGARSSTGWRA